MHGCRVHRDETILHGRVTREVRKIPMRARKSCQGEGKCQKARHRDAGDQPHQVRGVEAENSSFVGQVCHRLQTRRQSHCSGVGRPDRRRRAAPSDGIAVWRRARTGMVGADVMFGSTHWNLPRRLARIRVDSDSITPARPTAAVRSAGGPAFPARPPGDRRRNARAIDPRMTLHVQCRPQPLKAAAVCHASARHSRNCG